MDDILYTLCSHCVGIMDGWFPYPATEIAKRLNISVHKVRYHLKKLKELGFVESCHEGGMTEDGDVFCCWGWTITKKAFDTEEYKKAYAKERQICKECFDIDIGEIPIDFDEI